MAVANNKTFTLKSGEDMVISSTSKQVENTPPVSSPPLNNFFRMTKRQQQLRSKARSPKTIGLLQKSVQAAQSQDEESSGKTESAELSSGTSMEEIRNNSENCQLETDITSGGDMAISSNRSQVEEASIESSAVLNNSSRMARRPQKSKPFSCVFPAVSPNKSILLRQPRLLIPKYIPSQLVDESKNTTDSVVEVLIDDDSEMSVNVNAPRKMGPPPPKPAGSSKKRKVASKAISEKAKETADGPISQAQKVLNELAALQSEYVRLANRRNRVVKEFEKLKLEEDEMTPEETKGIRNMVKSTLRLDKNTKDNMQELVEFTEEWDKKNNNPLDRVLALQRNSIL